MLPLVIVKSFGEVKAVHIIQVICKKFDDHWQDLTLDFDRDLIGLNVFSCNIVTKYFKTEVGLIDLDNNDIDHLSVNTQRRIEAAFFYFDANDSSFLNQLDSLCEFMKTNKVEVGALLTHNLHRLESLNSTYEFLKRKCHLHFDVINLNEPTEESISSEREYNEVVDMLSNHPWSSQSANNFSIKLSNRVSPFNLEDQMNGFEELLNKVRTFKETAKSLNHDEMLDNAEKLAEMFLNVIEDD